MSTGLLDEFDTLSTMYHRLYIHFPIMTVMSRGLQDWFQMVGTMDHR